MCNSKYTTSQYSNHTQIHNPVTASDWPLVINSGWNSQETPLKEWVWFSGLTVTVHPCGSGNLMKPLGFVNSLFRWGPCEGCSSVSAKYQSQLRNRLERGRFFFLCCTAELIKRSYKQIQHKPYSSIHFTGITSFQASHYIPNLYHVKNHTSEGHHYSYETLNATSGDVCGWVDLLLLLCCANEDFKAQRC